MSIVTAFRMLFIGCFFVGHASLAAAQNFEEQDGSQIHAQIIDITPEDFLKACKERIKEGSLYYAETTLLLGGLSCEEFVEQASSLDTER